LPGGQGCSATKIGMGTPFQPHPCFRLRPNSSTNYCSGALT